MDAFIETPRFDEALSYGSSGGPSFKTYVFEGDSGLEGRVVGWDVVKGRWDVSKAIQDEADMAIVRAFFYNTRGRAKGFRFKDWADYTVTDEPIGTGDGVTTAFKIKKTYTAGALTFERRIFKPVSGTMVGKKDGVIAAATYDSTTGTITFTAAPILGAAVTASCQFDVPVRFDTDAMTVSQDEFQMMSWDRIPLVELMLED